MRPLSLHCPSLRRPLLVLAIVAACAGPAWALPTFDAVRREFRPSDTEVLDRDGALLQRVRVFHRLPQAAAETARQSTPLCS